MEVEKYENRMEYPHTPCKPLLDIRHTSEDVKEAYSYRLKLYESEMPEYRIKRVEYSNEANRLTELFKKDAYKELGLGKVPEHKLEILWRLAWEKGHHSGLQEVWFYLNELSELVI